MAGAASYGVNKVRASACEILLAGVGDTCDCTGDSTTPIEVRAIPALLGGAGIAGEVAGCSKL